MTTLTATRSEFKNPSIMARWQHAFATYMMAKGYSSSPFNVSVDEKCVITLWAEQDLSQEQKDDLLKQMTSLIGVRVVKPGFGPSEKFEFDYAVTPDEPIIIVEG